MPFDEMVLDLPPVDPSVETLRAKVAEMEQRLAAGADTSLPWWEQKVGPVPSWAIIAGIGVLAFLGWKRSR